MQSASYTPRTCGWCGSRLFGSVVLRNLFSPMIVIVRSLEHKQFHEGKQLHSTTQPDNVLNEGNPPGDTSSGRHSSDPHPPVYSCLELCAVRTLWHFGQPPSTTSRTRDTISRLGAPSPRRTAIQLSVSRPTILSSTSACTCLPCAWYLKREAARVACSNTRWYSERLSRRHPRCGHWGCRSRRCREIMCFTFE